MTLRLTAAAGKTWIFLHTKLQVVTVGPLAVGTPPPTVYNCLFFLFSLHWLRITQDVMVRKGSEEVLFCLGSRRWAALPSRKHTSLYLSCALSTEGVAPGGDLTPQTSSV